MKWEMKVAYDSTVQARLLAEGWEPFAAICRTGNTVEVFFRKRVDE